MENVDKRFLKLDTCNKQREKDITSQLNEVHDKIRKNFLKIQRNKEDLDENRVF